MKRLALLSLVCLVRCGSMEPMVVSPELKSYVDTVMSWCQPDNDCRMHDKMESIKLGTLPPGKLGMCYGNTRIVMDTGFWKGLEDDARLELMAHELAHCNWSASHEPTGLMTVAGLHAGQDIQALFMSWYWSHVVSARK